jgi:cell division protein FtsB
VPRLFTVRALVLFVVLLVAFVLLFPTVRAHLGQQAENRELAREVASARERTEDLEGELERWDDPAYVAAQARERLAFVRPGETAYRVVDPEVVPDPTAPAIPDAGTGPTLVPQGSTAPWYGTVWESVRVAGEAAVAPEPEPPVPAPLGEPGPDGQPPAPTPPGPAPAPAP